MSRHFVADSLLNAYLHEKRRYLQTRQTPGERRRALRHQILVTFKHSMTGISSHALVIGRASIYLCSSLCSCFVVYPSRSHSQPSNTFPTPDQEGARHLISLWIPDWYIPSTSYVFFLGLLHHPLLYSSRLDESSSPCLRELN